MLWCAVSERLSAVSARVSAVSALGGSLWAEAYEELLLWCDVDIEENFDLQTFVTSGWARCRGARHHVVQYVLPWSVVTSASWVCYNGGARIIDPATGPPSNWGSLNLVWVAF